MAKEVLLILSQETTIPTQDRSTDDLLSDIIDNWDSLSNKVKDTIVDSLLQQQQEVIAYD